MNPNLWYWSAALADLGVATVCAGLGWLAIRRGRRETHRKWMITAAIVVLAFLLSYPLKLIFLGKEDLQLWSRTDLIILRVHETCVLLMLLAGGSARWLAPRLAGNNSPGVSRRTAWHRRCGRLALVASVFALLTAAMILVGMFERLD